MMKLLQNIFFMLTILMLLFMIQTVSAEYSDSVIPAENNSEEITDFAMQAQALLGGYDVADLTSVASNTIHGNVDSFVKSKPSVSAEGIEIQSYSPALVERASEYEQVWYKFKGPGAINDALSIKKTGPQAKPEKILALAFSEARTLVPYEASKVDAMGYTFTFERQNLVMGTLWVPSKITFELRGENEVYIKTPTLVTSKILPVLGGMTYCKVLTPSSAARILIDLANNDHDRIPFKNSRQAPLDLAAGQSHSIAKVYWHGLVGDLASRKALLVLDNTYETSGEFKGTCVLSPGGFIPAISMRGLAKTIASKGYIVFILEYPTDLAFWESIDFREDSAIQLASLIKEKSDKINGLNPEVKYFYDNSTAPVIALGHSLGGAILGPAIFGNNNPFDNIILYGVTSFVKNPFQNKPKAADVTLFIGTNESKTPETLSKARNTLHINHEPDAKGIYHSDEGNRTMQMVNGLNHFCIISDLTVGMGAIREKDGEGPPPSLAVKMFVDQLIHRGLLY